ncbi:transposase [bacterium SCSIO 12741]|nr:transposase [bacterium SCSIO 12741]
MGQKNKIYPGLVYFLTLTVVDWVDLFTRPVYRHIIVDSLNYCISHKGLKVYSWVLMSNHLHLIASSDKQDLSSILRDFKKYTSKKISAEIIQNPQESRKTWLLDRFEFAGRFDSKIRYFKIWAPGNEAKEMDSVEILDQKVNYIHQNPVKAEWVENEEEYIYSSARNVSGQRGLVN